MATLQNTSWDAVSAVIAARKAKPHKKTSTAMIYYSPTTARYLKVWRTWVGWNLTEHDTCPCG